MNIGKSVNIAMAQRGKKTTWLMQKLDCSKQMACYYKRQERQIGKNIEKLAEVFDLEVEEFIALGHKEY
jgi:hypothetical protein